MITIENIAMKYELAFLDIYISIVRGVFIGIKQYKPPISFFSMFIILFAIVDLIVGITLAASPYFDFTGQNLVFYAAVLGMVKGLYSVFTAMASGFMYDVIGWIDIVAGFLLLLTTWGMGSPLFLYIGVAVVLKGMYSFMVGIMAQN